MKKYIVPIFWFLVLGASIYFGYETFSSVYGSIGTEMLTKLTQVMIFVFIAGISTSALVFDLMYSATTESLGVYKRELEKESIDKTENSSRVKVLESKIEVLEKALDEALKK